MLKNIDGKDWFFENLYKDHSVALQIDQILVPEYDTGFQKIFAFKNNTYGNVLVLDNIIQFAEFDEYLYHETSAHTGFFLNSNIKSVLIVGGGDCGVAREVLKHTSVDEVFVVDIDPEVTKVTKEYFPSVISNSLDDSRLTLIHEDAANIDTLFPGKTFDLIIIDSTDETETSAPIFGKDFLIKIKTLLATHGVLIKLGGSFLLQKKELMKSKLLIQEIFPESEIHLVSFSGAISYFGGYFSLFVIQDRPLVKIQSFTPLTVQTKWYSSERFLKSLDMIHIRDF